ncbi:MAG TPA: hypothetical protein DDW76_36825 [Cyanobacteria bacterium UBA11369]|nr:hypothetical protein [Cyanobacteria bacterium UBA11371]HBE30936.1 hypothetical protein [Cyanobacteria bacterium UBA11368]HBE54170.1 hypothetical protein [Cyanobacteria bacterium UBA11369]
MRFFNRVTLQTPESVELEFTLAGIGNRALALLIDYVALYATIVAFWIIWAFFASQLIDLLRNLLGNTDYLELWLFAIALLINFFIYVGYFVFFEVIWQGQTPGKRYTKIRVIREDGRRIGIQQATLRALLRPIDDILFLGAFLIVLNRREKRLGDLVAGTIVVQEESPVAAANFAISESAKQLAQQLPEMANLSQLLPDDFATIREYLRRRNGMSPIAKAEKSQEITRQVTSIIQSPPLASGVTADVFLEAVYLAYQQQSAFGNG